MRGREARGPRRCGSGACSPFLLAGATKVTRCEKMHLSLLVPLLVWISGEYARQATRGSGGPARRHLPSTTPLSWCCCGRNIELLSSVLGTMLDSWRDWSDRLVYWAVDRHTDGPHQSLKDRRALVAQENV